MPTVTSKDGTKIVFNRTGEGPAVILVDGALQYSAFDQGMAELANLLAPHFTVFRYDRRGRGESTDTQPYAIEREMEDLEAVINTAGGSTFVYGISSGASLAMEEAIQPGSKIRKLAMYEPPYNDDSNARQAWRDYTRELKALLAAGRRGDAVAPTLAYDHIAILGEDASIPVERAARVAVPTLMITGGASFPFMEPTARVLAAAIPHAQLRILDGQSHDVAAEALAPVLIEFFTR